jgi:hypothetical protein
MGIDPQDSPPDNPSENPQGTDRPDVEPNAAIDRAAGAERELRQATSREQAMTALDGLTVEQLKQVAASYRGGGIIVIGRPTKANLKTAIVEYAVGRRLDSEAIERAGNPQAHTNPTNKPATEPAAGPKPAVARTEQARPGPAARAPVSGALSNKPLAENGWGYDPSLPVSYHDDGPIGMAVKYMGRDARMDLDGEPLGNVLGRVATDAVAGRRTSQQALDEFKTIRDRLPAGSQARRQLDSAIRDMDAPASPTPPVPHGTPAPLRTLMADLHKVPLVRRDPSQETGPLLAIVNDFAAGKTGGLRMVDAVRQLANRRHESLGDCGKFEIDRAVNAAVNALSRMDRKALYPPSS